MNFFIPISHEYDASLIFNRKMVAKRYLKSSFIIDIFCCNPVGLFKYTSETHEGYSDTEYFLTFNYSYVPRAYVVLLGIKLTRMYGYET